MHRKHFREELACLLAEHVHELLDHFKVWVKVCTIQAWTPSQDLNITARACHSPNHNTRHKRAADECLNPGSIQLSPENIEISKF